MPGRLELAAERNEQRSAVAQRVATACQKMGVKVVETGGNGSGVLVIEDAAGTQFTVTVARKRHQGID